MGAGALMILFGLIAVFLYTGTANAATEVDPVSTEEKNYPQYTRDFSEAIAFAEGFGKRNARPTVTHNPGDIFPSGDTSGFSSDAEGWAALHSQVSRMFENSSRIYNSGMTIQQVAGHYTQTEQDIWAENVAYHLNNMRTGFFPEVSTETTLNEIAGQYAS